VSERVYFTVPLVPPSVNHYKIKGRGHYFVTKEAVEFKSQVKIFARGQSVRASAYGVEIHIYLGFKQKGDLDNFAKCVLDGLKDAGVIDSDAKITYLYMEKKRDGKNPRTEIGVSALTRS
jgi:Holliday junction resolvase RusA-like endonuclease